MRHHRWTARDYRSPHWRRVRAEARARTDGLCQFCGTVEGTEGHHLRYQRPELQEARWVVWLCTVCHDVATALRSNGFGRASVAMTGYANRTERRGRLRAGERAEGGADSPRRERGKLRAG